jgi:hypothetical protein
MRPAGDRLGRLLALARDGSQIECKLFHRRGIFGSRAVLAATARASCVSQPVRNAVMWFSSAQRSARSSAWTPARSLATSLTRQRFARLAGELRSLHFEAPAAPKFKRSASPQVSMRKPSFRQSYSRSLLCPSGVVKSRLSGFKTAIKPSHQRAQRAPVHAEEWGPRTPMVAARVPPRAGWVMWVPSVSAPRGPWVPKVSGLLWVPKMARECGGLGALLRRDRLRGRPTRASRQSGGHWSRQDLAY